MDLDEYRRESRQTWNELAPRWDAAHDQMSVPVRPVAEWLVERLEAREGETVLDIAAGNGDVSHALSPLVGASGRVISTDFAPAMVESSRRRGEQLGLSNVEYREMDAERMDLDDASVDRAACRFGFMLMADHVAALAEARRVLREGGRLVFAVWGEAMRNPWVLVPASVVVERGHMELPSTDGPGMFSLATPEQIDAALGAAGLETVEIGEIAVIFDFTDRDAMWERTATTMGPVARILSDLPEDERGAIRAAIEERAEPFRDGEAYALPGVALGAVARRA